MTIPGLSYTLGRTLYVALTNRCNSVPLFSTRGPGFQMPAASAPPPPCRPAPPFPAPAPATAAWRSSSAPTSSSPPPQPSPPSHLCLREVWSCGSSGFFGGILGLTGTCVLTEAVPPGPALHIEWVGPKALRIDRGRHPILDAMMPPGKTYVPNSASLAEDGVRALVITGPNMGGKSCFIRQTALIVVMAQCGSFVPAASAEMTVMDGVHTRMGASDNMAMGASTFLEEMSECSSILSAATWSDRHGFRN